jgi:hypothetical protein
MMLKRFSSLRQVAGLAQVLRAALKDKEETQLQPAMRAKTTERAHLAPVTFSNGGRKVD